MSADPVGKVNSSAGSEKSLAESTQGNSLKSKNTNHLNLFTFRHKQEEHRAVEEGDHDQAGEVGTMMIKLGRWRDEDAVSKIQLQEVSPPVQCQ